MSSKDPSLIRGRDGTCDRVKQASREGASFDSFVKVWYWKRLGSS